LTKLLLRLQEMEIGGAQGKMSTSGKRVGRRPAKPAASTPPQRHAGPVAHDSSSLSPAAASLALTASAPNIRLGRPVKAPAPGKRAPLSLLVTPELKHRIELATRGSGRTMAAEAEALIEQGLAVADVLTSLRTTVAELARRQAEKNFRERGYVVIHDPHGDIWLPPGHPAAPQETFETAARKIAEEAAAREEKEQS
jgi:hypothetical protein